MISPLYERFKNLISPFRLNISLALLPIFLWGYALTESDITEKFLYGVLILHLLIYPATNGLYVYFEKRRKADLKIWGAKQPSFFIFAVSLILLAIGIYLSQRVNTSYFNVVVILSILLFLYSYPETGIKSSPFCGILLVSISYGLLGFIAGWVCALDLRGLFSDVFNIGGAIASTGFVSGFYTLSLVYKVSEDSIKTGDLFIERLGSVKTFKFVKIVLPISGFIATIVIAGKFTLFELAGIIIYFLFEILVMDRFEKNFYLQKERQNYRTILSISLTNSIILSGYLLFRIFAVYYLFID